MLPALALGALVLLKKAMTAEVTGQLISRGYGYKPGEGPLSKQADVEVSLESEDKLGKFVAIAEYHCPEVMKGISGKKYRMTLSEYEDLKVLVRSASEFAELNTEQALIPLANFFHNFPQARVK